MWEDRSAVKLPVTYITNQNSHSCILGLVPSCTSCLGRQKEQVFRRKSVSEAWNNQLFKDIIIHFSYRYFNLLIGISFVQTKHSNFSTSYFPLTPSHPSKSSLLFLNVFLAFISFFVLLCFVLWPIFLTLVIRVARGLQL